MTQHKFQSRRYETRVVIVILRKCSLVLQKESCKLGRCRPMWQSYQSSNFSALCCCHHQAWGNRRLLQLQPRLAPIVDCMPSMCCSLRKPQRTKVKIPTLLAPNVGKSQNQAGFPTQNGNLNGPLLASGVACNPVFDQSYRPRLNLQSLEHIRWHFLLKVLFNLILLLVILERQQSGRMGGLPVWH